MLMAYVAQVAGTVVRYPVYPLAILAWFSRVEALEQLLESSGFLSGKRARCGKKGAGSGRMLNQEWK